MPRQYNTNQRWQVSTSAVCLSIQANDTWTFCQCLPGSKNHRVGKLIQLLRFHIHAILPPGIIPQGTEKLCPFPLLGRRQVHALQSRLFTSWGLLPSPLLLAAHPDCLLVGLSVSALALFQSIPHTAAGAIFPECKPDHVTSLPVGL